jgi:hypothetical protein
MLNIAARSAYFDRWQWDITLEHIRNALYIKCREQVSRVTSPTAAIIDARSVKSALGQVTVISQAVAVVATAVLLGPHRGPQNCAGHAKW